MDDAGTAGTADAGDLGEARHEPVDEGACGTPRAGMDRQPGRLVERHEIVVEVEERELGCLRIDPGGRGRGRIPGDPHPGANHQRCADGFGVDGDPAAADPLLDLIARDPEPGGEEAVEAAAGLRLSGLERVRPRAHGEPVRRRGAGAASRRGAARGRC